MWSTKFDRLPIPPKITSAILYLLKIGAPVAGELGQQTTVTLSSTSEDKNLLPGRIIPDGQGGVLATWTISPSVLPIPLQAAHSYQAAHVVSGAVAATYDLPFTPLRVYFGLYATLVLGEDGTAFATDGFDTNSGPQIVSFNLNSGGVNWNYRAGTQGNLSLIASASGNGLVAKTTDQSGLDTVLRFDASGNAAPDSWAASNIDYWAGDRWLDMSSGSYGGYSAAPVPFSASGWFALNMSGTNETIQNVNVTNFLRSGPNQDTITAVMQKIQTALPSNGSCNTWLQGAGINQGRSGLQQIQEVLSLSLFGHGTVNLGTTPYYKNAAFSGSVNPDKKAVPGIPAGVAAFTVNDVGAFFNATDNQGHLFQVGTRGYVGNTLQAQAAILHEVAHQITVSGFEPDNGIPKAGKANDKLVDRNCRQLIETLE
jgi:hypothetical protein